MSEVASLQISIDSTDAVGAAKALDNLAVSGERAGKSADTLSEHTANLAKQFNLSESAAKGLGSQLSSLNADRVGSAIAAAKSEIERLGSAAGLSANEIKYLSNAFGADIGALKTAQDINKSREALYNFAAQAGLSKDALRQFSDGFGFQKIEDQVKSLNGKLNNAIPKDLAESAKSATSNVSDSVRKMAEQSGVSIGQLNNAMRMVPMQFTDIATSLAGGMPPLTVLMQQGGQLKDSFGSASLAAQGLAQYVIGLINPFTLSAAAAGVLALAYNQGSKEADAYRLALVNTGNAAGVTTGQMAGMASHISDTVGTTGSAAAALTALAATGKVAGDDLEKFATAALWAQKGLGVGVEETAKQFAELGKSPTEASAKLNEQLNYLSDSTYRQIKAAQDLGDKEGAAVIAQNAYATAIEERGKKMVAAMGWIEKASMSVTGAAKGMWDALLDIGREEDPTAKAAAAAVKLLELRDKLARGNYGGTGNEGYDRAVIESEIAAQEKLISGIQKKTAAESAAAKAQAESARIAQLRIELNSKADNYLQPEQRAMKEARKLRNEMKDAGYSQKEISQRVGFVLQPVAAQSLQRELERLKEWQAEVVDSEKLAQGALAAEHSAGLLDTVTFLNQKKQLSLNALTDQQAVIELEIQGVKKSGIAQAEKASKLAGLTSEYEKNARAQVAVEQAADIEIAAARRKLAETLAQTAINDALAGLEAQHKLMLVKDADYYANAAKNEAAYQEERIRLAEEQYMLAAQKAKYGSEVEIAARQALQKVERDIQTERALAAKNAGAIAYEYARGIDLSNQKIEYEHSLLGVTQTKREELLALYDIEAQKLEKIRQIKVTVGEGEAQAKAIAEIEVAAASAKSVKLKELGDKQWQTYADTAESWIKAGWDALPNGAEGAAKAAWEKVKKDLFDQLYKLAAQPLVLNVIANITGQAAGGSAGGGAGGLLGQANSLSNLFGGGSGAGLLANAGYGAALGTTSIGAGSQAAMLAAQTAEFGAIGVEMTAAAAGIEGAAVAAGSAIASLSAAVPYVGAAVLAANVLGGLFGGDNNVKVGGDYQYTQGGGIDVWRDEAGRTRLGTNGNEIGNAASQSLIQDGIRATTDGINKLFEQLGSSERIKTLIAGAQSSSEKAEAYTRVEGETTSGVKFGRAGEQKMGKTASPEETIAAYQEELNRATIDAVQKAADIPKAAKDAIAKINPAGLSTEQFQAAVKVAVRDGQAAMVQQIAGMDLSGFVSFLDSIKGTGVQAVEEIAGGMSQSIQATMAGALKQQFAQSLYDSIMLPMVATHTFSKAAADSIIADFRAKSEALKTMFASPEFQGAMNDMASALAPAIDTVQSLNTYIPATSKSVASLADTASSASNTIADAVKKEADEKKSLQDQLDKLTMSSAQLRAKEREAISESNRSLFDSVKAREDEVKLNDALKVQADAMRGLQADLLEAQGDAVTATAMRRAAELEGLKKDFDDRAALRIAEAYAQKTALEDQVAAAKELQSITDSLGSKTADLRVKLLQGRGDDVGAKALQRQQELDNLLLNKGDVAAAEIKAAYQKNALLEDQIAAESKLAKAMQDVDKLQKANAADAIKLQKTAAEEQAKTAKALVETIQSARKDLIGSTDAGAKMQADAAREFIRNAALTAQKTGYLPDEKELSNAINAIKSDTTQYASAADEVFAKMMVAGDLAGLEDISKSTLDKAEQAQKTAEAQLAALEGNNATALAAAQAAQNDAMRQLAELVGIREAITAQKAIAANMDKSPTAATSTGVPYRAAPVEYSADLQAAAVDKFAYYTATIGSSAAVDKMLADIKGYGYTMPEAETILGLDAGTLTDFAASVGIPAFASGANIIPSDMLAVVHQGEAIIPAPFNPYLNNVANNSTVNNNQDLLIELRALREEVAALRVESARSASLLNDVTEGGNGMRVVTIQ